MVNLSHSKTMQVISKHTPAMFKAVRVLGEYLIIVLDCLTYLMKENQMQKINKKAAYT